MQVFLILEHEDLFVNSCLNPRRSKIIQQRHLLDI
jgi:hypothetical protein